MIVVLENPQADADFISEMIKTRLDQAPEVQLSSIEHEGHILIEVKIKTGMLTPYYYYQDGTRTAYVRVGNESVECNSQQLLSLVLKGTHMTWDSLPAQVTYTDSRLRYIQSAVHARNPVIADMFTQLDYMEKRGSGLRKMRELTEKLPNFMPGKEPQYQTEAISFYTTFYNLNWGENGRIPIEEVANRVNSSLEKYSIDEESSVKTFGDLQKSSVKTFGDLQNSSVKQKRLGRTAQSILDLVISDGSISQDKMAEKIGVSKRAIEMQIANLKAKGLLVREGADHGGYWRIVINPKAEE